ncbi:MAG TPA: riboflavin kinase [Candidatus Limnocylindria bacterium]|nr:riboflavin kinase [Candidatus Limnocylindria bacterium]
MAVFEGVVMRGKRLGSRMGIPTANIPYPQGSCMPEDGVYVADMALLDQGERIVQGVLNQGYHPTVPGGAPAIEAHIFDFNEDIYGQRIRVRYLAFLRPELTFESKEAMLGKMHEDLALARKWFRDHPSYLSE